MAPLAASNPRIRRLRRLSGRRSARLDDGAFVLEGPVLIAEAERIRDVLAWQPRHDDLEQIVSSSLAWERKLAAGIWSH